MQFFRKFLLIELYKILIFYFYEKSRYEMPPHNNFIYFGLIPFKIFSKTQPMSLLFVDN